MKQHSNGEIRIGFYICHCGHNIAAMVDCPDVARYVEKLPGVTYRVSNVPLRVEPVAFR